MSITQHATPRRRPEPTMSSLVYASLLGMAASVLHGRNAPPRDQRAGTGEPQARAPQSKAGAGAATPADIPSRGWWVIAKRTVSEVNSDRVLAVAGGVTFYGLLSLFPAITVLVSIYGLVADPQSISQHLQMLSSLLPEGALSIIGEQVTRIAEADHSQLTLAAAGALLIALWSANSAMKAMMDALNIAYDADEQRGFIKLNLVSLAFTLSAIIGLIVMMAVIAAVPVILQMFWLGPTVNILIWAGRWPLIFGLVIVALAVLYRYGPSRPDVPWRWITPGSLVASFGLVIFSMLFSWYAAHFANYNKTYGSLGAAVAFMTWMWLSATIVLAGAELNSEIENQAHPGQKPGETGASKT